MMRKSRMSAKDKYIQEVFATEDWLLKDIKLRIKKQDIPINITPTEGKTLQLLLKLISAKNIVEIGTFAGYSTVWLARILPEEGKIYTIEYDVKRLELAKRTFEQFEQPSKIHLCAGKAEEILPELAKNGPFDAVFIDANKDGYLQYLEWADQNVRSGGLIIADNSLLFGAVYKKELPPMVKHRTAQAMKEFNQRLADSNKYLSVLLPTNQGMTVAVKN